MKPKPKSTLLYYKTYGEISADVAPIIILHGLLGSLDNWQTQAKRLAQHHYVLSIDLRNHGHSPHIKGMSYRQMAEDVLQLLDYLQIPHIKLLGHSMGGKVAMYLALYYPQRIQSLIVVDIAPKTYPLWHQSLLQGMLVLPVAHFTRRNDIDRLLSEIVENAYERGFLLKNLRHKATGSGYEWKCDLAEIARNYLKIAGFPYNEKRYYGKVLFVKGGLSVYLQAEDDQLLGQYFVHYNLQVIEEAGHLPHVEQPNVFYELIEHELKD